MKKYIVPFLFGLVTFLLLVLPAFATNNSHEHTHVEPTPTRTPTPKKEQNKKCTYVPTPTRASISVTPTPTIEISPSVTPETHPPTHTDSEPPHEEKHPYGANECHGIVPKEPTLLFSGTTKPGCVSFNFFQTDPFDHAMFLYGYEKDRLIYGIPYVPNTAQVIEICQLEKGRHVWGQLLTETKDYCVSRSEIVDPVVE